MICYASRTGTRRNLATLRSHGWRLLVSRAGVWRTEGFAYCADNGAWSDHLAKRPFDEAQFGKFAPLFGPGADFIVAPDIIAGGTASLALSARWIEPLRQMGCKLVLLSLQDGMDPSHIASVLRPGVGLFLGGSTAWKLATMQQWGEFAHRCGVYYHVARVNTAKRMRLAHASGAHSVDGSSGSRFAISVPPLDRARRQPDLLAPKVAA